MKIAIIGAGNMGGAIARALAQSDFAQNNSIYISNRSKAKLDILKESFPQLYTTTDNSEAASGADIVIIAVKPWILDSVAHEIASCVKQENCMIISVVAAIPFSHYDELFCGYHPTFRVIPNTAAVVGEGISVIAANHATQAQTELVQSIFNSMGITILTDEDHINAYMVLCSSGTALAMRYLRAAMEAGIAMGIPAAEASRLAAYTMRGTAQLIISHREHPEAEIDRVTTPGGLTIKGLIAMEEAGFSNAVIKGHLACLK